MWCVNYNGRGWWTRTPPPCSSISTLKSREKSKCSNFQTTMALCQRFTLKFQISMPVPTYSHQIQLWYPTPSPRRRILEPRRPLLFPSSAEMEERKPTTVSPNSEEPVRQKQLSPTNENNSQKKNATWLVEPPSPPRPKTKKPNNFRTLAASSTFANHEYQNQKSAIDEFNKNIVSSAGPATLKQYRQLEFNWECLMSYQEPNLPNIWYSDVVQRHFLPQIVSDQYIFILPRN